MVSNPDLLTFVNFNKSLNKYFNVGSFRCAGEAVTVEDEVVVINSIVLPNKVLNVSVQEEIIL